MAPRCKKTRAIRFLPPLDRPRAWPLDCRLAKAGTTAERLTAHLSNRKRLMRGGMEHLLGRHQPWRQPLRMMMSQERLQYLAIGCEAVGPEVVPHQLARGLEQLVDERQRAFAGRG